jgi:hypothetical protein
MSLEKLLSEEIDRREFLETSGKAALAVGGGLTLDALLSSCATIGSIGIVIRFCPFQIKGVT